MKNILEIENITKKYESFTLDNVSFNCPEGKIMGLIGANGAGKTTVIKSILNIIRLDGGNVNVFGKDYGYLSRSEKESIAVVFDENNLPDHLSSKEINNIFKRIYQNWDENLYWYYLNRFEIPAKTPIRDMSKGNKVKINLAVALAHHPRLLILDEITGALDPMMREEILKLFLEFVRDTKNSILFSSHITTDLDKIADSITFINRGHVVFCKEKDDLINNYKIARCNDMIFETFQKKGIIAYRKSEEGVDFLLDRHNEDMLDCNEIEIKETNIEDLMLIFAKGELI